FGTDYQTHRGSGYAGWGGEGRRPRIKKMGSGQFKDKFEDDYLAMRAMGDRARYGLGAIGDTEQPLICDSHHGTYVLATTGRILNEKGLVRKLIKNHGASFTEVSTDGENRSTVHNPTEIASKLINLGRDLEDGVRILQEEIEGSISGVMMKEGEGIYAFNGTHWPLILGEKEEGWAVTTETCAFPNLGFEERKHLSPGEMVHFNQEGYEVLTEPHGPSQICTFLWVYTGFPASNYMGINAGLARERCGAALAKRDFITPDFVAGVPDSGNYHAMGCAMEMGIPYRMPLTKYTPSQGRSYTAPEQWMRDLIAKMKLIPIDEMLKGYSWLFNEDSIVRNTQLRMFTLNKIFGVPLEVPDGVGVDELFGAGAREVHIRPACPPLLFACNFGKSVLRKEELVARRAVVALEGRDISDEELRERGYLDPESKNFEMMINWIRDDLDSMVKAGPKRLTLMYQRLDDMIEAIGVPEERVCTYCWNGKKAA
ncbi:MAG: hypothetical protein V3V26_01725, partial [Candidatus Aenigmarchaeota archaeon]